MVYAKIESGRNSHVLRRANSKRYVNKKVQQEQRRGVGKR